jgi:hypothetical protein
VKPTLPHHIIQDGSFPTQITCKVPKFIVDLFSVPRIGFIPGTLCQGKNVDKQLIGKSTKKNQAIPTPLRRDHSQLRVSGGDLQLEAINLLLGSSEILQL